MNKEQYNLTQKLDPIWRLGDRDEMSIKHIGHALAALVAHGDWRKGDDYNYPKFYNFENETHTATAYRNLDASLEKRWAKVTALFEAWGTDKFRENASATPYGYYMDDYLEASWLSYSKALNLVPQNEDA